MKKIFTILLLSVCFVSVPSCQKDSNGKGDDPNRLSTQQAKEYFEQHSTCLRFLSVGGDKPSGTKSVLTAYAYSGFSFAGWYENGLLISQNSTLSFVVS